jgi:glucose/arabinose dehydrogenase/mono/diheme cytochrome c family protein
MLPTLVLALLTAIRPSVAAAQDRGRPTGAADVDFDALRPGLIASYRSLLDADTTLARIDAKPAFTLGRANPHPRIPPGPFEVMWSGVLYVKDPGPIRFGGAVCGEVTVEIDRVVVLQGRGEAETSGRVGSQSLTRDPGLYPVRVRYRSLPDLPARLQLWWEGPTFSREPLPAWHLYHQAADVTEAVSGEQLAERGRLAIERVGCARCHASAFPAVAAPPPGPSVADAGRRIDRGWLLEWLADPAKLRPEAGMPALFAEGRAGFVERWLIAEYLFGPGANRPTQAETAGDHRVGRRTFISLGCAACHSLPDASRDEQPELDRTPLTGLAERLPAGELAAFLGNPHARYPDGRMPRLPVTPEAARDIAAFLLLWSKPAPRSADTNSPTPDEIARVARRLGVRGGSAAGAALLREKRCAACHPGVGQESTADVPLKTTEDRGGCLSGKTLPRFTLDRPTQEAINAYCAIAAREKYPSAFASRQRLVQHLGCVRCHQRDSDRPSPLETAGSTLGASMLMVIPYQRAPRLTDPHQKYRRSALLAAVRDGVSGLRPSRYTYRMPAYGHDAEAVVQALAEADGELPDAPEPPPRVPADQTLGSVHGPLMVGFQGYGCVSCHMWNGQTLAEPDPGSIGPDLTKAVGRIRRDWFDRYLENPARAHPGTPMPSIFAKGKPATLATILDSDAAKQKDALWSYFALGRSAPSPKPPPPLPVTAPAAGEPVIVGQIPARVPGGGVVESICVLTADHDLIVYDLSSFSVHSVYVGGQLLRGVQGRLRTFTLSGTPVEIRFSAPILPDNPRAKTFLGYERLPDGVRIHWRALFTSATVDVTETLEVSRENGHRQLRHEKLSSLNQQNAYDLPAAQSPQPVERAAVVDPGATEGSLERPGYRAIAYPRPKGPSGEDLIMPGAVAVNPKNGRVFVASMKLGEIFVLKDPTDDGKQARFENYARGLFQEAYSMLAEPDALYVLHRRNLTKIGDTDGDGVADRFDRVAALPHGIADSYDYGYGLVRDRSGAFVYTYAPYANTKLPGSGGALRLVPGQPPQEVAYGFRNPIGWCTGPDSEVFFTDNQGEWVATNKLCHLSVGRFYGFPNPAQRQHTTKPPGKAAVWVPYDWAHSLNGVTYDNTGGKFGPFAGQFFIAELMFGGAIIRADLEKVNGEYQGACFPFWGRGLLGPLCLAFDPRGRLFVGGITEPGWMTQPDRGALFRIDYTGAVPFEMQSIRVLPNGFRIVFTRPVAPESAHDPAAYQIEHYRYEYTGAYGSPELDRTRVSIERVEVSADGRSADLITTPLVKDRVYMIQPRGVRSATGEPLVHAMGAYTLNEIPGGQRP